MWRILSVKVYVLPAFVHGSPQRRWERWEYELFDLPGDTGKWKKSMPSVSPVSLWSTGFKLVLFQADHLCYNVHATIPKYRGENWLNFILCYFTLLWAQLRTVRPRYPIFSGGGSSMKRKPLSRSGKRLHMRGLCFLTAVWEWCVGMQDASWQTDSLLYKIKYSDLTKEMLVATTLKASAARPVRPL